MNKTLHEGKNQHHSHSLMLRDRADRLENRTILLAMILVFAHLLDLRPTSIEQMSIKITISDQAILYGGISLIFLHSFYMYVSYSTIADIFHPINMQILSIRSNILSARRLNRKSDIKTIKIKARSLLRFYNIFMVPYWTVVFIAILLAIGLSVVDLYRFGRFVFNHSSLFEELREKVPAPKTAPMSAKDAAALLKR